MRHESYREGERGGTSTPCSVSATYSKRSGQIRTTFTKPSVGVSSRADCPLNHTNTCNTPGVDGAHFSDSSVALDTHRRSEQ